MIVGRRTWLQAIVAVMACAMQVHAQVVQRPTYKEGDTWTYRHLTGPTTWNPGTFHATETRTVTKVSADEFELSTLSTSERGEQTTGRQVSSLDFNDFAKPSPDVPRQEIRTWIWPTEVGRTWKYEVPTSSSTQIWEARVVGWEEVEVPAGRFKALKVEREMTSGMSGGTGRRTTVWFSPEAKANVKVQTYVTSRSSTVTNYTRELISYKVQ